MSSQFTALVAVALWVALCPAAAVATEGGVEPVATASSSRWDDPEVEALIQQGVRHDADGDYAASEAVWKRLGEIAPHHPGANVHAADTMVWLQIFEDDDRSFDDAILRENEEGVRKATAWIEERPDDARAHLYLGQALMNLGRLHGVRLRIYKAGTYGDKAVDALERALELDPDLTDAKYSIGLYAYYASVIPDLVQWLSFLWFVPKADAPLGLRYLDEVRRQGDLYRFTAAFYLANIRSYHDKWLDHPFALATVEQLHEQHPQNSLVHFELLEILMLAERYQDVAREALALEAHGGTQSHDLGRVNMARVWRARAELFLGRPEPAWQLLESFGDDGPDQPSWGNRWVSVTRGQIKDALGERDQAIMQYERVTQLELNPRFSRATEIAAKGVEEPFRPRPQITAQEP